MNHMVFYQSRECVSTMYCQILFLLGLKWHHPPMKAVLGCELSWILTCQTIPSSPWCRLQTNQPSIKRLAVELWWQILIMICFLLYVNHDLFAIYNSKWYHKLKQKLKNCIMRERWPLWSQQHLFFQSFRTLIPAFANMLQNPWLLFLVLSAYPDTSITIYGTNFS